MKSFSDFFAWFVGFGLFIPSSLPRVLPQYDSLSYGYLPGLVQSMRPPVLRFLLSHDDQDRPDCLTLQRLMGRISRCPL
jgi:hypothetical protein